MRFSIPWAPNSSTDLIALRRLIEDIAHQYRIDLSDRAVIARIMDCDYSVSQMTGIDPLLYQDYSDMLRLLVRLEGSSSEDLGVSGISRLWERQREILKRFDIRNRSPANVPAAAY